MKKPFKKIFIFIIILAVIAVFFTVYFFVIRNNKVEWDQSIVNYIYLDNAITVDGNGMTIKDNTITISHGGYYEISGESDDVNIIVNFKDDIDVNLILNNAKITATSGTPLLIKQAKNVIVTLTGENVITDTNIGRNDEENATIFSTDDLFFTGNGSLTVNSNYGDAIASKDQLVFDSGTFIINSVDDGLRGKDYIEINNGDFTITTTGDAIKSTNTDDKDLGYIVINNGNFIINSECDGINSASYLTINNGTFDITTGGGSENASTNSTWGMWGNNSSSAEASSKAIKAQGNITIVNGTFNINSSDDSIHSNNEIIIKDGSFNIKSGDDGIHADTSIVIDNADINIEKSYEGIESALIEINSGKINVVASDDGINIAGGNDSSSLNNRPGSNNFNYNSNQKLTINGGYLFVNAKGDGLDANGSIYINDGTVIIDGPSDSANGSLDYDGEFVITSGELIASGSSGMLQYPSNSSSQYVIVATFSSTNSVITIKDENNNNISEYTPTKSSSSIIYSSADLKENETYSIYINNTLLDNITITQTINSIRNSFLDQPFRR